jgi:hypothetical protein
MSKRVHLKWPPRVRQPRRPVTITRVAPLYGPVHVQPKARVL